ncbi:cory-CC-star protein, partial [Vibrio cincinnatiensis]|uniref:cory-CC-star protein n=2 Tax=Vibrio cincinnatiensis TaxID=675 RepID=UPI001EE0B263
RLRRLMGVADQIVASRFSSIDLSNKAQDDLFMLLIFSEMMGVPNPASYYTLELQPILIERFHDWHLRMGMPHSPLDQFKCC